MLLVRLVYFVLFLSITVLCWFLNKVYFLDKLFYTSLALTATYFFFKLVLQELLGRHITDEATKYKFKKTVSILFWIVFMILFIRLWVVNPQALLVAYGLVAAGVAISLQDFFKNFVGGITIFANGLYRVGDRIEIDEEFGDVIDIGLTYTTVMEMRNWVSGDQATGRICTIPNGLVLSHVVNNYTKEKNFIWDEITLPITYDSDWKGAINKILAIIKKETADISSQAEKEIKGIKEKYFLRKRDVQPAIYLTMTDNWITFSIRYVVDARSRRQVHSKLTQFILDEIQKSKNIKIASTTLSIVDLPEVRVKKA